MSAFLSKKEMTFDWKTYRRSIAARLGTRHKTLIWIFQTTNWKALKVQAGDWAWRRPVWSAKDTDLCVKMKMCVLPKGQKAVSFFLSFKDFIYLLLERGREGEREKQKHQCVVATWVPPTGDLTSNPGMCPDWESNWRPFGSQASIQSTEPYQPGLLAIF